MNKKQLKEFILSEIAWYEKEYGFSPNKGFAQVHGKKESVVFAYGKYDAYKWTLANFKYAPLKESTQC